MSTRRNKMKKDFKITASTEYTVYIHSLRSFKNSSCPNCEGCVGPLAVNKDLTD